MKIVYSFLGLFLGLTLFLSCEEGEIVSGAPTADNVEFVTLQGTIATSSPVVSVVPGQRIPLTITLPQAFPVDVNVEVTSVLPNINRRTRKIFLVRAGQTTINDLMNVPGPEGSSVILPFNSVVNVYLSAITTGQDVEPKGFEGKQYALTSNVLSFDFGDSALAGVSPIKFTARLDWLGPHRPGLGTWNNLDIVLKRDGSVVTVAPNAQITQPIYGTTTTRNARYETVNFLNASAPDGVYTIEVFAQQLITSPVNLPYRFTVRLPNESANSYIGTLNNLTVGTAATAIPLLQITKVTTNGVSDYDVQAL